MCKSMCIFVCMKSNVPRISRNKRVEKEIGHGRTSLLHEYCSPVGFHPREFSAGKMNWRFQNHFPCTPFFLAGLRK